MFAGDAMLQLGIELISLAATLSQHMVEAGKRVFAFLFEQANANGLCNSRRDLEDELRRREVCHSGTRSIGSGSAAFAGPNRAAWGRVLSARHVIPVRCSGCQVGQGARQDCRTAYQ